MTNIPEKKNNEDVWDWKVKRGEILLLKESLVDNQKETEHILPTLQSETTREFARTQLMTIQGTLNNVDDLIEMCNNAIDFTVDYEEALGHLAKLKRSGKINILTAQRIAVKIGGNLELEYIKKCLRSVDNSVRFSTLLSCSDSRLDTKARLAFTDLYGDEMIFTATIRREVVSWLQ